jgi:S-adenosylmethionine synthetase
MGREPKWVEKVFQSPYSGRKEARVELFTWEKLDAVEAVKQAFGL